MLNMNGIDSARLIREKLGAKCPSIIALTAEALEGDRERFLGLGFDGYPFGRLSREPSYNSIAVFVLVTVVVTVFPVTVVMVMFMIFVPFSFFAPVPLTIVPMITVMLVPFAIMSARYSNGELLR
jgi:hypothetical protein